MHDFGLWKNLVFDRWMKQANRFSILNQVFKSGSNNFEWKKYYQLKELMSRKGTLMSYPIKSKGPTPSPRYQHTGTTIGKYIYYIGGQETQVRRFSDIFKYNTETNRMIKVDVTCSGTSSPPKFARHTSVAIGNKIFVFGGFDGSGVYFDLAIFDVDTLTWSSPAVTGTPPRSRTNHASAAVGNDLYVFGGINRDDRWELQDLDEFFVFNTITSTWREINATGAVPSARCGHRLVSIGKKLYMFGGGAGESWRERYNDIHIYDTETNVWRQVPCSNSEVQVCTFSSVFVLGPFIGVFGGQHLVRGKVTKKIYFFDTISETWIKQDFSGGTSSPAPRDMATANVVGSKVYIMGGYDGSPLDQLNVIELPYSMSPLFNIKYDLK
eukprot:gene5771-7181_t